MRYMRRIHASAELGAAAAVAADLALLADLDPAAAERARALWGR